MATVTTELPLAGAGALVQEQQSESDQVSQWTLMRWRFLQNRLSVVALILLLVMYIVAAIAPFIAPNDFNDLDTDHSFAAPTSIVFRNAWPSVCPPDPALCPRRQL